MQTLHFALSVSFVLTACSPAPFAGFGGGGGGEPGGGGHGGDGGSTPIASHMNVIEIPSRPESRLASSAIAVSTSDGKLAVLRASDGTELAQSDSGGYGGLFDLSFDPKRSILYAYEENDEGDGAEIAAYPLELEPHAAHFGLRTRLAWVDGIARVLALPRGLVTFEENIGQRWRISSDKPSPSIACPRPASIIVGEKEGHTILTGVSSPFPGDGPVQRIQVTVKENGLGKCHVHDLLGAPSSARLFELQNGREVLAGVAHGKLALALVGHRSFELGGSLDLVADTVEEALVLDQAKGRVALLLTGPSRVVVVDLATTGDDLSIGASTHLELRDTVRREDQFFSRELAAVGERIFVATDAGVRALDVGASASTLTLGPVAFAGNPADPNPYRGPIAALEHSSRN